MKDEEYYSRQIFNQYASLLKNSASDGILVCDLNDYRLIYRSNGINSALIEDLFGDTSNTKVLVLPVECQNGQPILSKPSVISRTHLCLLVLHNETKCINLLDSNLSCFNRRVTFENFIPILQHIRKNGC